MAGSAALSKLVTLGCFWLNFQTFLCHVCVCLYSKMSGHGWGVGHENKCCCRETWMEERDAASSASIAQETQELIMQESKTR